VKEFCEHGSCTFRIFF